MSESPRPAEFFEMLSKVLLRCWIFGLVLGFIGYASYALAADSLYQMHAKMFALSKHEVDLIFYCGMGLLKLSVIVFFLIPWLAIRVVVRKPTP